MRYLFVIILLLSGSCATTGERCSVDSEFVKEFENCLLILSKLSHDNQNYTDNLTPFQIFKATNALELITKSKGQIQYNDGFYWYETRQSFLEDSTNWRSWLDNNGCFSKAMAHDTLMKYRDPMPNYSDSLVRSAVMSSVEEMDRDSAIYRDSISHIEYLKDWPEPL